MYNTLLKLSRNIFFYQRINLPDTFETRIYLMFFHFSIMLIISKKKGFKFDQNSYDGLFHNIENNLRESGLGDVTVNKRMKDLNKVLYNILLKIEEKKSKKFKVNKDLISIYFQELNDNKSLKYLEFESYFDNFYNFCFELSPNSMIRETDNFKFYGSS